MYKKALVTGGDGLGGKIAIYLAEQGYDIALASGNADISSVASEIEKRGVRYAVLTLDMADYAAACALPARAAEALGGLSLCVNAAMVPMDGVLDEQAYRVNLRAPYGVTAQAAAVMAGLDVQGAIVNVVGDDPMSAGLERVTRSAALEFSQYGINVNNVRFRDDAEETARLVAFFGSMESDYITGQTLCADAQSAPEISQPRFIEKKRSAGRPCALITGGSHGIGAGLVRKFADLGYDIAFTYSKRLDGAEETQRYLDKKGVRGFYYQASFDEDGAAEEVGRRALRDLGRVDLLINNAGITIFENRMENVEAERLDKLYHINYRAAMILTRMIADDMIARDQDGCVVNISSVHGTAHYIYDSWYGGVKYALNHATRLWAAKLAASGIRVNAIAPGGTRGGLTFEEMAASDRIPLGRCARPLDIAKCANLFAQSRRVSGQVILVDGGFFIAGVPETGDPEIAGQGWSTLRRRWNQDTIDRIKAESDWL